ncbi:hypothetical protein Hypma_014002 [Hypsizygus marmoreus]|uniref:Uncharacterized protein n=1 Tax=Hypsizygus marmoreus TaxID=39966 RepID=A0A369K944_HYPMA|nr:hypothetical protein Hypma_014002 [Hypsizygus marmoreus]
MEVNGFNLYFRHPDLLETLITRAKYPSEGLDWILRSQRFELVRKADNGSIKDLRALGTKLENEYDAPLCLLPEIIDTLFRHVRRPPPASSDAASDKDRMELARASLHGIGLAVMWNMSCGCLETDDSRPLTASRLQSMIDIQGIISWAVYRAPASLYNIVIATPGLIFLLGEIWTRQSDRPRNDTRYREGHLLNIAFFKAVRIGPDLEDFDLLVEAVCSGPAKLRHVMLKPLQLAAYGGQLWSFSYPSVLGVYSALSRRCPRLCNVLPLVDIMLAICHALTILSFIPPPRSPPLTPESIYKEPDVDMCVHGTCDLIFALSQTRDDFMWINTAIRNDFIPSILRSGLNTSNDDTVDSINTVFEFIRIHLCYRTILRSLAKVMTSASVATLASQIPPHSKLALVWERFSSTVRVELEAKTVFDKRGLKYAHKCSSPQVRSFVVNSPPAIGIYQSQCSAV